MRYASPVGIGGPTTAAQFFKGHGYKTHLVLNSYLLQGSQPIVADVVFPQWGYRSGLSALYRGIGGGEFKTEVVFQDTERDAWLSAKRSILSASTPEPKVLYAHSGFPGHSQTSGNCLEDETARYAARVATANDELTRDVETILSTRRDAIIIVAGDHGPYLTGDCRYMSRISADDLTADHLADRYGAKLAIRWPDGPPGVDAPISVIQDVLFAVTAYLLDDERVWQYRLPNETLGYGGIPNGALKDGMVMVGRDKGRPLFEPKPHTSASLPTGPQAR
jgi:hypothetical protein